MFLPKKFIQFKRRELFCLRKFSENSLLQNKHFLRFIFYLLFEITPKYFEQKQKLNTEQRFQSPELMGRGEVKFTHKIKILPLNLESYAYPKNV